MLELNKIYNEDCLQGMKRIPDGSVDLTVTSPPYDCLRTYNGNIKQWSFEKFQAIAKELYRVTKQGGVVVWIVGDATINGSETGTSFRQALYFKEIGFNLHDTMIYAKNAVGAAGSRYCYQQSFEYMFVLTKGKIKTFNPIKDLVPKNAGKPTRYTKNAKSNTEGYSTETHVKIAPKASKRKNVWYYNIGFTSQDDKNSHPAVFPEQLAQDHIISWSNEGDLVLDPFMGSGTTAKMAVSTGRKYIGYELSKEYCDIAEKRIQEHTQQMAII
jgi:site-specific DNA-methyltransferase (adenine-specific)